MIEPVDIKAVVKRVKHKLNRVGLEYLHFELEPLGDSFAVRFYAKTCKYLGTSRFRQYEPTVSASTPEELEDALIDKAFNYLRLQIQKEDKAAEYEFVKWEMEF